MYRVHTVDYARQFTRHAVDLQPINIFRSIGRRNIFGLFSKEDGTRIAIILPGRREVEDGDEVIALVHEIVLADNRDAPHLIDQLRYIWIERIDAWELIPKLVGILLNGRELILAIEAGDVEQLTKGTNRATGSTPLSFLSK